MNYKHICFKFVDVDFLIDRGVNNLQEKASSLHLCVLCHAAEFAQDTSRNS
jgi:hypothetical protein